MVFEGLSEKLQKTLKNISGKGKVSEKDIDAAMREVKLSLLEADVNFKVVKEFIKKIKERSVGAEVMDSLTPGQQVIKIVREELTSMMGEVQSKLQFSNTPPSVILLVGLQGAGKTTTIAKLGRLLKKQGKTPMAVACDVYRPAAIKQLEIMANKAEIAFFSDETSKDPAYIAKAAYDKASSLGYDVLLIDTAGRLHVDDELMGELVEMKQAVRPQEILLIVDSMTGQDAVKVAQSFDEQLGIDGVILTKLDGDTRGGAALSIRAVTQKPIKFIATGEKLDDMEVFHPDRMASRILGMGDVLSLIEKAQESFDQKSNLELEEKINKQSFNFLDFQEQMQQLKKMGSIKSLLEMIPGIPKQIKDADIDDSFLVRIEAIIQSMTKEERERPELININRRKRIAKGSGTTLNEVNKLMKQFDEMKKMMKQMNQMGKGKRKNARFNKNLFGKLPGGLPNDFPGFK